MRKNLFMLVLWPGFLGAIMLEMMVFALVDPLDLHVPVLGSSSTPLVLYTAAFFVFWIGTTIASILTSMLAEKASDIDDKLRLTDKPRG